MSNHRAPTTCSSSAREIQRAPFLLKPSSAGSAKGSSRPIRPDQRRRATPTVTRLRYHSGSTIRQKNCAPRVGTSSRSPMRPHSISFSPSATTRQTKYVQSASRPITAHWGVPDPAAVEGDDAKITTAFRDAYLLLEKRIELFANLPVRSLDRDVPERGASTQSGSRRERSEVAAKSLPRRLAAEALGTAFLLMAVVGSGVMGERLVGGNDALALLEIPCRRARRSSSLSAFSVPYRVRISIPS